MLLLAVVLFLSPKADAQSDAECFKEYQTKEYKCLQKFNDCTKPCTSLGSVEASDSCRNQCSAQDKTCSGQASTDLTACKAAIPKDKEDVPSKAESGQDCRKIFDKESYKCLTDFNDCSNACLKETEKPDGSSYFNSGEIYKKCMKSSDCEGKNDACDEQALANFRACSKAGTEEGTKPPTSEGFFSSILKNLTGLFSSEEVPALVQDAPKDTDIESISITAELKAKPVVIQPVIKQELSEFVFADIHGDPYLLLPDGTKVAPKNGELLTVPLNTKFIVPNGARMKVGYALDPENVIPRGIKGLMSFGEGSQVEFKEFRRTETTHIGSVLEVQQGTVRFKGTGVTKKLPPASIPTSVFLGAKGTDYAVFFDKKDSKGIIEIYDGEVEITGLDKNKTISSTYGAKIQRIEVLKDKTWSEKTAVPRGQFYKNKILTLLPIILIIIIIIAGIFRFTKRKKKK